MSFDATRLEIFKSLFHSVAEEMGGSLRRAAFSPNIKERRDYSCAVFDHAGDVIAMGDHMPVHLGSMPHSVTAVRERLELERGDIALLNDPFAGGTHLPDLTMVMPVFAGDAARPAFYVANRAHHADIGGANPGSMALSREIFQEGLRIPPVKMVEGGKVNRGILELLLANVRTPEEREGDLTAQVAACRLGERRMTEILWKYGGKEVRRYAREILDYSERMMRAALRAIPAGTYRAEDFLDDDGLGSGPLRIAVRLRISSGRAEADFAGSAAQCAGSVNAVRAITESAVFYVFRCLLDEQVPASSGLMRPLRVSVPRASIVAAEMPAAVAGGNVETSQRIVDALLRAMAQALPKLIPAASQGTMNNLTFGCADLRRNGAAFPSHTPTSHKPFAYYETIAGGMGARPGADGESGIHTHMTNSLNTPVEAMENAYPVRIRRYAIRRGSGGTGLHRGGDGVIREFEFLSDVEGALLCDRRRLRPYGLWGGEEGAAGRDTLQIPAKRGEKSKVKQLPSKCVFSAPAGSVLRIETPGGGGWGRPQRNSRKQKQGRGQKKKAANPESLRPGK